MPSPRWILMYFDAFRGLRMGLRERSFAIHIPATAMAIACGIFFHVSQTEWLVLVLCITGVVSAELLNTGLERMAKAVTRERNAHVGAALDIASAGVLVAALGAVVCGLIIFLPRAWLWLQSRP